jgi:hypothetical protein
VRSIQVFLSTVKIAKLSRSSPLYKIVSIDISLPCRKSAERVFLDCGSLWIEAMGNAGISHARLCKLIPIIVASWFVKQEKGKFDLLGDFGIDKSP